jgi:hypothetical protein
MGWQIEYFEPKQTVVIKTSGSQDIAMARQMVVEAAHLAAKFGAKRFLKDDRDSVLELSTVEIYWFPQVLLEGGIPRDSRIAVIRNSVPSQAADFEFFKTRMYNEGMPNVRIFGESTEQALEWLAEPTPAKTGPLLPP